MAETYEEFRSRLINRHTNRLTDSLSTVGDLLLLAAAPAWIATRNVKVLLGVLSLGISVVSGAHLFQRGTLKQEYAAVFTHPAWALRAELSRVRRHWLAPQGDDRMRRCGPAIAPGVRLNARCSMACRMRRGLARTSATAARWRVRARAGCRPLAL